MKAIIMAGGKGTRLCSEENPMPKVLRCANGRPLLAYVLDSVNFLPNDDITIVVGYMADDVKAAFPGRNFALQGTAAYGTGYAVMCGIEHAGLENYDGEIAVLSGDVPLVKNETIASMFAMHRENHADCTLLSCVTEKKLPFGRIIRDKNNQVTAIKEHKDCTEEERKIKELNIGLYIFDAKKLNASLKKITDENAAKEYYLTDVPLLMLKAGDKIEAYITGDEDELWGVNTFEDLAAVEKILTERRK